MWPSRPGEVGLRLTLVGSGSVLLMHKCRYVNIYLCRIIVRQSRSMRFHLKSYGYHFYPIIDRYFFSDVIYMDNFVAGLKCRSRNFNCWSLYIERIYWNSTTLDQILADHIMQCLKNLSSSRFMLEEPYWKKAIFQLFSNWRVHLYFVLQKLAIWWCFHVDDISTWNINNHLDLNPLQYAGQKFNQIVICVVLIYL